MTKPSIMVCFLTVTTNAYFRSLCFAFQFSYFLAQHQYFVCPVEYNSETNRFVTECEPSELFQMKKYSVPPLLQAVLGWVRRTTRLWLKLNLYFPAWMAFWTFFRKVHEHLKSEIWIDTLSLPVAQMGELVTWAELKCLAGVTHGNLPVFSLSWEWMSLKHFADKPVFEEQHLHFLWKAGKGLLWPKLAVSLSNLVCRTSRHFHLVCNCC